MELWKHQKEAITLASKKKNFALFMEVGTGKTATCIHILRDKYNIAHKIIPTLILCPPIVILNWKAEFKRWSKIPPKKVVPLIGSQQKRIDTMLCATGGGVYDSDPVILITNYESLQMDRLFQELELYAPKIIVFDESHRLKDPSAKRTKKATQLADKAEHKYILSGTPVLKNAMDLFSQYRILDGGETFGANFFGFRAKYFYDKNAHMPKQNHFPNWVIRPNSIEEINRKLSDTSIIAKKSECLDLPPLIRKDIFIPLSKEQQDMYLQMKKDLIAFYQDQTKEGVSVATIALTKALRLMQIMTGFITMEDKDGKQFTIRFKENPRRDALKEVLSELCPENKVIVWAVFKENYDTIREVCTELGLKYTEIHGDISSAKKQEGVTQFNTDPDTSVIFGHPASGGIGINLIPAGYSIYYSKNFSLENDLQSEARNYRGGSEIHETITRIDFVAPGTIDERVNSMLKLKIKVSEDLLKVWSKEEYFDDE